MVLFLKILWLLKIPFIAFDGFGKSFFGLIAKPLNLKVGF
jgi:hypothetical protein